MFEIYTFFENRTEIRTFFENRIEICILFENRFEIYSYILFENRTKNFEDFVNGRWRHYKHSKQLSLLRPGTQVDILEHSGKLNRGRWTRSGKVIEQGSNLDEYLIEDTTTGARAIRNRKFLNPVYAKGVHFNKDLVSQSKEEEDDDGKVWHNPSPWDRIFEQLEIILESN